MFGHLVNTLGAVELDEVHRFTHECQPAASLRLPAGDSTVLDTYQQHGRIHTGSPEKMETEINTVWKQARDAGHTVALMANSNETVNRLNNKCQQLLVDTGQLDPACPSLEIDGQILYQGNEVVTRRNNRTLRTNRGLIVKNRDHWTNLRFHGDGTVTVTGPTGTVTSSRRLCQETRRARLRTDRPRQPGPDRRHRTPPHRHPHRQPRRLHTNDPRTRRQPRLRVC